MVAFFSALALVVGAIAFGRRRATSRAGRVLAPAVRALGSPRDAARIASSTVALWLFEAGVLASSMRALGFSFGVTQILALTTIGVLVIVIPGVPSSAGTLEAGLVF